MISLVGVENVVPGEDLDFLGGLEGTLGVRRLEEGETDGELLVDFEPGSP